jgi:Zinc finger, C2H2 type
VEVFQCPECDLRFRFASELEQHMSFDHPEFEWTPKTIEDALMAAAHRRRRAPHYRGENQ